MIVGTHTKQPGEVLDYDIRYTSTDVPIGDTLTSAVASWVNEDDPTDTTSFVLGSTNFVNSPRPRSKTWVAGGLDGSSYKVTVIANTLGGRRLESEFVMKIKEF